MDTVLVDREREIVVVTINRPEVRNAVDAPTAEALVHAFREYDRDERLLVAVVTGAAGAVPPQILAPEFLRGNWPGLPRSETQRLPDCAGSVSEIRQHHAAASKCDS